MSKTLRSLLISFSGPVLIILIWILCAHAIDNKLVLPQLNLVLQHFLHPLTNLIGLGNLLKSVFISLLRVFLGYSVAVLLAIPIGVLMGYNKTVYGLLNSVISLFRPIPPISWVPLVLAWFGVTSIATIVGLTQGPSYVFFNNFKISMTFIIFLGAFFPIVTSSIHGVKNVQQQLIESAYVLGGSKGQIFSKILLPAAAPTIFNGMRTGLGVAWTCLVSAEMLPGSLSGIGYLIMHGYELARVDVVMTGMISISIVGALLDSLFRLIENKKFSWQTRLK